MNREQREADFVGFFGSRVVALRRLAYALCGDWHTAEDLTQSAFVAVYRRWGHVRLETADAYARRVLVNTFLSHRRRHRRESVVPQVRDEPAPGPGDPALRLGLSHVLAQLPPRQRAAVVLRHLADLSVVEVADLLGMAEGTVKSQTARGLETLKKYLESDIEMNGRTRA